MTIVAPQTGCDNKTVNKPQGRQKMARKTTKSVKELLEFHQRTMEWIVQSLLNKSYLRQEWRCNEYEKTEEYWIGMAQGLNMMVEEAMMRSNCYHGFHNIDCLYVELPSGDKWLPTVGPDHPRYADWRRRYYSKD